MSFEDDFRATLQAQAGDLDVRGRGARETMRLARRRQHRARRAGVVAAVGVLGAGAAGVLIVRSPAEDVTVSVGSAAGLTPLGPLELTWQATDDGLSGLTGGPVFTEAADGVIYALSTAPGSAIADDGTFPEAALYRLAEDGSWQPTSGIGTAPRLTDLASDGTVLYSLSTSPSSGGAGYDTRLSSSADGGQTWNDTLSLPVTPPSSAVAWTAHSNMQIEANAFGDAIAVVSTGFAAPWSLADDAADAAGLSRDEVTMVTTEAGIDVVRYDRSGTEAEMRQKRAESLDDAPLGTAVPPTAPPETVPDPAMGTPTPTRPPSTTVRTYTWADLGVAGPAALQSTSTVLVREGGAWVPVDGIGLGGIRVEGLDVIGPDFVVRGSVVNDPDGMSEPILRTMASSDGRTWRLVAEEVGYASDTSIVGVGDVWVQAARLGSLGAPPLAVSTDRGASWQEIDLTAVDGRLAGGDVVAIDGGPLGLAAVVQTDSGATGYLLTTRDLVEWTVTPMAELSDQRLTSAGVGPTVVVGADRIVVTTTSPLHEYVEGQIAPSVTLIGTPVR